MVAVGKKNRPAVGLVLRSPDALCEWSQPCPIGMDALDRTIGVRRIDDYTLATPTAAACGQSAGEPLRRAARDCHLLQFAVGEKRDVGAIRRPEGITCALGAGQKR